MRDRFEATVAVSSRSSSAYAEPVERDARNELRFLAFVFSRNSCDRPNVLTLSCKSRPPHRGSPGGAAAAATNTQWRERTAADVAAPPQVGAPRRGAGPRATGPRAWRAAAEAQRPPAVQFGAARGGSAAGPTVRRLLSACEGS